MDIDDLPVPKYMPPPCCDTCGNLYLSRQCIYALRIMAGKGEDYIPVAMDSVGLHREEIAGYTKEKLCCRSKLLAWLSREIKTPE